MKTLYIDCGMGAAGDMLTAALLELIPDREKMVEKLNSLGIPDVKYELEKAEKCGITGSHMKVTVHGIEETGDMHDHHHEYDHDHEHYHDHEHDHDHEHHHEHEHEHDHDHHHEHEHDHEHHHGHVHHGLADIEHVVKDHMDIPGKVKDDVLSVFGLIAEAESKVHGKPVSDIHFHEVGTMDAVADIAAVCLLINEIAPDRIIASPVHVGSGTVKCAHGILPVPAPATALILKDIPIYGGEIKGELCTPTGAALLKHFVTEFGNMPIMKTEAIGYGMGKKDFERANCVRVLLGESEDKTDRVIELSCNIDDMTAESVSYAVNKLFKGGALDVYTAPIGMKKGRMGTLIRVLCKEEKEEEIVSLMFKYTSTIGIRRGVLDRFILDRKIETTDTPFGQIRKKVSSGYGTKKEKYEYDDISRIADETGKSISEVLKDIGD